jgi:type III secretion system YscD/HrpQ family protein
MNTDTSATDSAPSINTENAPDAVAGWELVVFGGLHRGAQLQIGEPGWCLVGSADDCDVVLRDAGVHPHHLVLYWQDARLFVRALDASATLGGVPLEQGAAIEVVGTAVCQVESMSFGVGRQADREWQALRQQEPQPSPVASVGVDDARGDDAVFDFLGSDAAEAPAPAPSVSRPAPLNRVATFWAAGLLALVLCGGLWGVASPPSIARAAVPGLSETVSSLGLPEVRVVQDPSGQARLEGTVGTESQRSELIAALGTRGLYPAINVVSGEHLAMIVQDTFRQRGLVAQARYAGTGRVEVDGVPASALTERVVREILQSTGSVKDIALTAPAPSAPTARGAVPADSATAAAPASAASTPVWTANALRDPKRVIGVVGGEQSYLLTLDGSHYLTGSMLPNGSLIEAIEGYDVVFMQDGQRLVVQF